MKWAHAHDTDLLQGLEGIYLDDRNPAYRWALSHPNRAGAQELVRALRRSPPAVWIRGSPREAAEQVGRVTSDAAADDRIPIFVLDRRPGRRCHVPLVDPTIDWPSYRQVVGSVHTAIDDRPAIVVVEPGSLSEWSCLSDGQSSNILNRMRDVVRTLAQGQETAVIADGGGRRPRIPPNLLAERLERLGLQDVDGLAFNVAGYTSGDVSEDPVLYAQRLRHAVEERVGELNLHLVVDTSRAARHPTCNPTDLATYRRASLAGRPVVPKYAWLTTPGISDGPCGAAPQSERGEFVPRLAVDAVIK